MDPNPNNFPILSYVMSRLPSFGSPKPASSSPRSPHHDIEQPHPQTSSASTPFVDPLVKKMPHLKDPKVIEEMTKAVTEIAQARSVIQALGERPDHETIDRVKEKIAEIDEFLSRQLEEIILTPEEVGRKDWRSELEDKEKRTREKSEKEKQLYKSIIQLDEMHESYHKLLKEAEAKLMRIYDSAAAEKECGGVGGGGLAAGEEEEEVVVNDEVVGILRENAAGKVIEKVDLSGKKLRLLPEAFGKISGLVVLNLSNNQLQAIPDSICGLGRLEVLNLYSNLLELLPDSIGLLANLKILNVSGNKLQALPDSLCYCRLLVEVDASFNHLAYLPTNIGHELVNLRKLSVQYNKINSLPTSIGDMRSLQHLDLHFNELRGLPFSIGMLRSLETLNLSGNFSDLTELPDSFGDLINLRELDLSNNQIHALPDTFGRLESLTKLNLDQNPIVVPPMEQVNKGVVAVKAFMAKRWLDILEAEEARSLQQHSKEETENGWLHRNLSRSTSWLTQQVTSVSEYLGSPRGSPRDPVLDQEL